MHLIFVILMQVHTNIDSLPAFKNAVVTIGTFDGVHAGHRQIIAQLKEEAAIVSGETVIVTFHPHPRKIVSNKPLYILTTLEEKQELLRSLGIDHLVVVPFNDAFANLSADEYIRGFLVEKLKPHTVIIGYDHKFGHGRQGNYKLLETYGRELGFVVKEIPEHVLNAVTVSSTRIREALLKGDIATANEYLGRPYFFSGKVVEGNKLGRTIGYPTANLLVENEDKLIPGNGVYAVTVSLNDKLFKGMMNIGTRPTIDGTKRVTEVNIFDFNEEIYGQYLRVNVYCYLRGEVKFSGLEQLKEQLAKDKISAMEVL